MNSSPCNSVAGIDTTKKRGRPPVYGSAMSQGERDRRYRLKRKLMKLAQECTRAGLDPARIIAEAE